MASTTRVPARFTLAHGLMILAGLITFVLVVQVLNTNAATVTVLAAQTDQNTGEIFAAEVQLNADDPFIDLYARPGDNTGMYIRRTLTAGEPILKSDLLPKSTTALGRTFNFEVNPTELDGLGLVKGDLVDVIGVDDIGEVVYVATGRPVVGFSNFASGGGSLGGVSKPWITIGVSELDALRIVAGKLNPTSEGKLFLVRSTGAEPVDPGLTMDRPVVPLSLIKEQQEQILDRQRLNDADAATDANTGSGVTTATAGGN